MGFSLSVLDQSPIAEGSSQGEALRNSLELARAAERAGYRRYWAAEHHGTPGLACNAPEVLIGPIAAATERIRVGSGGVMLPHYSPLKVAENFSMLASLYPGRIDLGVGRAPGSSGAVARALQRDRRGAPLDDFPEQMEELFGYLENRAGVVRGVEFTAPALHLVGSSGQSAVWAAEMGLPYVFADFINPGGAELAKWYREHFVASAWCAKPWVGVCAWAICADTDAEAMRLSYSMRMTFVNLFRGKQMKVPRVEEAEAFLRNEGVSPERLPEGRRIITGLPGVVRGKLEELAAQYGADEVFVVSIVHGHEARVRGYELIAGEFKLATDGRER